MDPDAKLHPPIYDLLACPKCRCALTIAAGADAPRAVDLRCGSCATMYPTIRGIPRFATGAGAMAAVADSFGFQWTEQAAGTFEDATIYGESEEEEVRAFLERMGIDGPPGPTTLAGLRVLDAGCGSGRLTASLARMGPASVIGLDISSSVEVASRRLEKSADAQIVQGDLLNPPLLPGSFDLVWSEGVLHHTPDARGAFERLAALVKPGGSLYVWLYPPTFNAYRLVRDVLPFAWRLPRLGQLALCRVLAVPLWAAALVRGLVRPGASRGYREVVFGLHDNLSPQYQTRHSVAELTGWFVAAGFCDVRSVGPVTGVVGRARARASASPRI